MDELLDIVDDKDNIAGQEMRSTVHQLGLQHRGAHVFLFTRAGKMLVQKRSADRAASPSMLDCSVSEHVKAGESYFDAALRGMKEEMGVDGIEIDPLVTFRMNYGINDNEISRLFKGIVDPESLQLLENKIGLQQQALPLNADKPRITAQAEIEGMKGMAFLDCLRD